MKSQIAAASVLLLSTYAISAQEKEDSGLYQTLKGLDDIIFKQSFNKCDHAGMIALIPDDFEFYHDVGGLETSKQNFVETVKQNICGNMAEKPVRKLVPGSLQVYPLYKNGALYGAIQKGEHEFYIRRGDEPLQFTSAAKFTHVWMLHEGAWKLKRVLSYDHQSPE